MGKYEDRVRAAAAERGMELGGSFEAPPELNMYEAFFYNSFWELNSCRPPDGLVPWTAIKEYAVHHRVSDFDAFTYLIFAMDTEYQGARNDELERSRKQAEQKGKRSR
jgi:hypothetical protein